MISSEFRLEARKKLDGKWKNAVFITLASFLVFFVIGFIRGFLPEKGFLGFVFSIIVLVIEVPLQFGLVYALFNLYRGKDVKPFGFWTLGFDNFSRAWKISFSVFLKLIVPFILVVISYVILIVSFGLYIYSYASNSILGTSIYTASSYFAGFGFFIGLGIILLIIGCIWGIVKSYYYLLAYYIAFDNPDMSANECVLKSRELMTNNRGKLFCLHLSFFGWAILAILTLGIGYFWLLPYIQFSIIVFYEHVSNSNSDVNVIDEKNNDDNPIKQN